MEKESIALSGMAELEPARKTSAQQGTVTLKRMSMQARSQVVRNAYNPSTTKSSLPSFIVNSCYNTF